MSQLFEQIQSDLLECRKIGSPNISILRTLVGQIQTKSKSKNTMIDDTLVLNTIKTIRKGLEETISYAKDNRPDTLETAENELNCLNKYMPKILTESELIEIIQKSIDEGSSDIGSIMKHLKEKHTNLYDGKIASIIIKDLL